MITCGSDGTFKIWDISTDVATAAPTVLTTGTATGQPLRSCKFYIDNYILVGDQVGQTNIYYPYPTLTIFQQYTPQYPGITNDVDTFYCKGTKFFLNGLGTYTYFSNGPSPFLTAGGTTLFNQVELSDNFVGIGDTTGTLKIFYTSDFTKVETFTISGSIKAGDFTDSGMMLAVGGSDKEVKIFQRCTGCTSPMQNYFSNYCSGSTSAVNVSCMTIFKSVPGSGTTVPSNIIISDFFDYYLDPNMI